MSMMGFGNRVNNSVTSLVPHVEEQLTNEYSAHFSGGTGERPLLLADYNSNFDHRVDVGGTDYSKWTLSFWHKLNSMATGYATLAGKGDGFKIWYASNNGATSEFSLFTYKASSVSQPWNKLGMYLWDGTGSSTGGVASWTSLFAMNSTEEDDYFSVEEGIWYHFYFLFDGTQSCDSVEDTEILTNNNRFRWFINGQEKILIRGTTRAYDGGSSSTPDSCPIPTIMNETNEALSFGALKRGTISKYNRDAEYDEFAWWPKYAVNHVDKIYNSGSPNHLASLSPAAIRDQLKGWWRMEGPWEIHDTPHIEFEEDFQVTSGSDLIELSSGDYDFCGEAFYPNDIIVTGTGIPADTYVIDGNVEELNGQKIQLSADATAGDGSNVTLTFSLKDVIIDSSETGGQKPLRRRSLLSEYSSSYNPPTGADKYTPLIYPEVPALGANSVSIQTGVLPATGTSDQTTETESEL